MKSNLTKRIELMPGVVISDSSIQQGAPVFAGTEVLVKTLLDYRDGHSPLYEFLLDFPEVRPWQAKKFIEWWTEQEKSGVQDVIGWLLALRDEQRAFESRRKSASPRPKS